MSIILSTFYKEDKSDMSLQDRLSLSRGFKTVDPWSVTPGLLLCKTGPSYEQNCLISGSISWLSPEPDTENRHHHTRELASGTRYRVWTPPHKRASVWDQIQRIETTTYHREGI